MSRSRVLAEHSSRELSEWLAFDLAFGLGCDADLRAGIVAAAMWNARGGIPTDQQGKNRRAATPADFFPHLGDGDDEQPASHDAHDQVEQVEPDDDDDDADARAATQALKSAWAAWGISHNAAIREAERLEPGDPPADPEAN